MLGVRAYSEGGRNDKEPQEAHSCEGDRRENSMHDPTWGVVFKNQNQKQCTGCRGSPGMWAEHRGRSGKDFQEVTSLQVSLKGKGRSHPAYEGRRTGRLSDQKLRPCDIRGPTWGVTVHFPWTGWSWGVACKVEKLQTKDSEDPQKNTKERDALGFSPVQRSLWKKREGEWGRWWDWRPMHYLESYCMELRQNIVSVSFGDKRRDLINEQTVA